MIAKKFAVFLILVLAFCMVSFAHADTLPLTYFPLTLNNGESFTVQTVDPAVAVTITPTVGTLSASASVTYNYAGGTLTLTTSSAGNLRVVPNLTNTTITINGVNTAATVYSVGATIVIVWSYQFPIPHPTSTSVYDNMMDDLNQGDIIKFFTDPLTNNFGAFTYFIFLVAVSGAFYIRYRNINIILFLFILFGGAGGLVAVAVPGMAQIVLWMVLAIGLAGLLFRVFR